MSMNRHDANDAIKLATDHVAGVREDHDAHRLLADAELEARVGRYREAVRSAEAAITSVVGPGSRPAGKLRQLLRDDRTQMAHDHAAKALELAASLNLAGDETTLPSANLRTGERGPWGHAYDCAGACLQDVYPPEMAAYILDRAIRTDEATADDLRDYAAEWDAEHS
jgi:hypothetical protein